MALFLGSVIALSVLIPTGSQVNLPEMVVETDTGQVIVRNVKVHVDTFRPMWGMVVLVLVSLLAPVLPLFFDADSQARKDAEERLPSELRHQLVGRIRELQNTGQIAKDKATEALRMVDSLPTDRVEKETIQKILNHAQR